MPAKILVVEDDADLRLLTVTRLKNAGYQTIEAANGELAIELAESQSPDLILLDLGLPRKGGKEVCQSIRERDAETPIIVLTARTDAAAYNVLKAVGANDFIIKPAKPQDLLARIEKCLQNKPAPAKKKRFGLF